MTQQLFSFWAGGAVCCLIFTLRLQRVGFRAIAFALLWPITVPLGVLMYGSE